MALQGNLKEMSLATLIQVNCQEMRSARLTLTHAGQSGEVFLGDGQVVHAVLGAFTGQAAIYELLAWDEGTFVFDRDVHTAEKTITQTWNELLLEGMKRAAQRPPKPKPANNVHAETVARLKAIDGVAGAVISASDGIVLSADVPNSDGEAEAALAVFMGTAADQLGEALQLGAHTHTLVTLQGKRVLVLEQPDRYLGLVLGGTSSPALIATAATQIFHP